MRREENHGTRRVINMNVERWRGRGRPKKRWIDCEAGYEEKAVSDEMTSDRGELRSHAAPTPSELGQGQKKEEKDLSTIFLLPF
jgi:hypothetical protein